MDLLPAMDWVAFAVFVAAWSTYHFFVENKASSLNAMMNGYRVRWMHEMSLRENRIIDGAIMASLQNGTAFFASSSLIALGGSLALLRGTDDVLRITSDLSLSTQRGIWELKVLGLAIIFGYTFLKFSWAYRLFNFASILLGATPSANDGDSIYRRQMAFRAGKMAIVASIHFSRGQRSFFFAIAYLGWFLGPWGLIASTLCVLYTLGVRQFSSNARQALSPFPPDWFGLRAPSDPEQQRHQDTPPP